MNEIHGSSVQTYGKEIHPASRIKNEAIAPIL
jgi:hypothetical protein